MPVSVIVLCPRFRKLKRRVERIGASIFRAAYPEPSRRARMPRAACEVYLADGRAMRRLGSRLQNHRGAWNVLAFRAPPGAPRPDVRGTFLGEIYLDPAVIAREARRSALPGRATRAAARSRGSERALAYFLAHGILHLLGYDHARNRDRMAMEKQEERILKRIG